MTENNFYHMGDRTHDLGTNQIAICLLIST